jgi:hypothetical protein
MMQGAGGHPAGFVLACFTFAVFRSTIYSNRYQINRMSPILLIDFFLKHQLKAGIYIHPTEFMKPLLTSGFFMIFNRYGSLPLVRPE